jgi:hypothetical protein
MAITFQHKIILRPGSMFCFGTISSVADEEGILHRRSTREKAFLRNLQENRGEAGKSATSSAPEKTAFSKPRTKGLSTRRTPLSTSPTEEWTQITRRKEANEATGRQAALPVLPSSREDRRKIVATTTPFYPDVLFIGRAESPPIPDDELTAPGEEPP